MNKKYFAIVMFIIYCLLPVMPVIIGAEEAVVVVNKEPIAVCGITPAQGAMTGNGYITYEAKNVDALYEEIKKAITRHQAIIKNFNMSNSPDMKYKNLNLEVTLDIADAPAFMNEISNLKTIKNQNYNQYAQSEGNIETLQQELGIYNDRLNKALATAKADVEVIKLIVTKITETENRIRSLEMNQPMINKAKVNITIRQTGYPVNYDSRQKKDASIILTVIIAGMAIIFFVLGLFSIKLTTRIKKKKADGQIV